MRSPLACPTQREKTTSTSTRARLRLQRADGYHLVPARTTCQTVVWSPVCKPTYSSLYLFSVARAFILSPSNVSCSLALCLSLALPLSLSLALPSLSTLMLLNRNSLRLRTSYQAGPSHVSAKPFTRSTVSLAHAYCFSHTLFRSLTQSLPLFLVQIEMLAYCY